MAECVSSDNMTAFLAALNTAQVVLLAWITSRNARRRHSDRVARRDPAQAR